MSSSTSDSRQDHGRMAEALVVGACLVMVLALWLPWHRSGERTRDAFELSLALDRLDLDPVIVGEMWGWLVPVAPVVGALAWIAAVRRRRRALMVAAVALAVITAVPSGFAVVVDELREAGELTALAGFGMLALGLYWMRQPRRMPGDAPRESDTGDYG